MAGEHAADRTLAKECYKPVDTILSECATM